MAKFMAKSMIKFMATSTIDCGNKCFGIRIEEGVSTRPRRHGHRREEYTQAAMRFSARDRAYERRAPMPPCQRRNGRERGNRGQCMPYRMHDDARSGGPHADPVTRSERVWRHGRCLPLVAQGENFERHRRNTRHGRDRHENSDENSHEHSRRKRTGRTATIPPTEELSASGNAE